MDFQHINPNHVRYDLPSEADIGSKTTGDLAAELYPSMTYDTALPQPWVDRMADRGVDVRGRFVWGYPKGTLAGFPFPLTLEAAIDVAIASS